MRSFHRPCRGAGAVLPVLVSLLLLSGPAATSAAEPPAIGWRNDGTGHFPDAAPPLAWGLKKDGAATNIAWATEMPFYSPSSVISAGSVLFTTANDYSLLCVEKKTGKILWVRSVSPYDAATKEDRTAHEEAFASLDKLARNRDELNAKIPAAPTEAFKIGSDVSKVEKNMEKLLRDVDPEKYKETGMTYSDGGYMATTPAWDGTYVYAWNARGVTACFDLKGDRKWIRFDKIRPQEHGHYGSPLIVQDKVVIYIGKQYLALDRKTGKEVWKSESHTNPEDWYGYWYGSAVLTRIGEEDVIVAGDGSLIRAKDGVRFLKGKGMQCCSPVVGGGCAFWMNGGSAGGDFTGGPAFCLKLPADASKPATPDIRTCAIDLKGTSCTCAASPLFHDGLLYIVGSNPVLIVYDVAADKVVYRKDLDFGQASKRQDRPYGCGIGASPTLAGGKIFIVGNLGTTLILEPGRVYKEVGRNTIERHIAYNYQNDLLEGTVSNPFFEGKCIYYRAQKYLYCIESK